MTPMVIGLDLSIAATGIARPDGTLLTTGGPASRGDRRLADIVTSVAEIEHTDGVDLAVIEDLPIHAHGAGITGMVHGAVRLLLIHRGVPYVLIPPATLKKYATGNGGASKADMRMAWYKRTGLDVRDDNQADAAWLRAAGLDHLGEPLLPMPKPNRAALAKVAWPALNLEGITT